MVPIIKVLIIQIILWLVVITMYFCFLHYRDSKIPDPPQGHKWKEVRHDNRVTWLSSWTENIQGSVKYVMLNAASKLKVRNRGVVVFRPAV